MSEGGVARREGFYRTAVGAVAGGVLRRVDYVWSDGDGARVERNEPTAEELRAERDERCDARESEEVVRFGIDRSGIRDVR